MVPTARKLPLWNGPPIFLTHLGSQESKKTGGTWSGEKTPSGSLGEGVTGAQGSNGGYVSGTKITPEPR